MLTVPVSIAVSYGFRDELSVAPLLYATNQGIVGYFIATYIDRSLSGGTVSWQVAGVQAAVQFVAALLVFLFAPLPKGFDLSVMQQFVYATFFACQPGLAGFLVGSLFQYFYRRTTVSSGQIVGDITVGVQPAS